MTDAHNMQADGFRASPAPAGSSQALVADALLQALLGGGDARVLAAGARRLQHAARHGLSGGRGKVLRRAENRMHP